MFRKKKSEDDLGNPVINVLIELACPSRFDGGIVASSIDKIEACGLAIHIAKKILAGNWHLTSHGYLQRGHRLSCETVEIVIIDIDGFNIPAISILEKILAGKIKKNDLMSAVDTVDFHSNNYVERIGADERGLYFLEMKQKYENEQASRQILA